MSKKLEVYFAQKLKEASAFLGTLSSENKLFSISISVQKTQTTNDNVRVGVKMLTIPAHRMENVTRSNRQQEEANDWGRHFGGEI